MYGNVAQRGSVCISVCECVLMWLSVVQCVSVCVWGSVCINVCEECLCQGYTQGTVVHAPQEADRMHDTQILGGSCHQVIYYTHNAVFGP